MLAGSSTAMCGLIVVDGTDLTFAIGGPQPMGRSARSWITSTRTGGLGRMVMVGCTFSDRPATCSPIWPKFCGALADGLPRAPLADPNRNLAFA